MLGVSVSHHTTLAAVRRGATVERIMRQQFVECDTIEEAQAKCPWAAEIVEVDGGYMCFESVSDYETWAAQI